MIKSRIPSNFQSLGLGANLNVEMPTNFNFTTLHFLTLQNVIVPPTFSRSSWRWLPFFSEPHFCPDWLGLSTQNKGRLACTGPMAGRSTPNEMSSSIRRPAASCSISSITELSISSPSCEIRKFMLLPSRRASQCPSGNSHHNSCRRLGPAFV
jgi:hypothetical protein